MTVATMYRWMVVLTAIVQVLMMDSADDDDNAVMIILPIDDQWRPSPTVAHVFQASAQNNVEC